LNKIDQKDLGSYQSADDYLKQTGIKIAPKKNHKLIGLREIGPRVDFQLERIEVGLFNGTVLEDTQAISQPPKPHKHKANKK
jgi:hypothetical protein